MDQQKAGAPPGSAGSVSVGDGPVNFIDVKVHGVYNLPAPWSTESGPGPVFNDHIFRYEVDLAIAGQQHTFRSGRILQTIPMYTDYIDGAKLPPPVGGTDHLDDVVTKDAPEAVALAKRDGGDGSQVVAASSAADSGVERHDSAPPATPGASSAPSAVLWILGPEADTEVRDDMVAGKKDGAKPAAKKGGPAVPAPTTTEAAVKPIAPNTAAPPAAVCRFPLTLVELSQLEDQLEKHPQLVLTFRRVLRAGCPAEWEDALEPRYQAHINVSLKPLLEPGSTFMQATVPLEPVIADTPAADDKSKGASKKAAPKKTKGAIPACLTEELDPAEPHPYAAAKTHCVVSIRCHVAVTRLPQARPRPDLQPSDLIPRRLRPPKRPADATKQFSREVEQLAWRVIRDYREHKSAAGPMPPDALRQSFLQYLSTSGKTHVYKELLVPSVQGIVKETFIRKPSPSTEELDRVSSELYTYVLDQSHLTLSRTFTKATRGNTAAAAASASNPEGATPVERWRRLAMEAEVMREYAAAAKYHQECIVHSRGADGDEQPDVWCEYAEFCLRVRDALKAEQAYREALAIDMAHMRSLLGYGCLLLSRHRFMEAEVLLQSAVTLANDAMSWGVLAAYYDALLLSLPDAPEDATRRAMCRRESKLAMLQAVRIASEANGAPVSVEDMYQRLAARLLELHQEEAASMCLARSKPSTAVDLMNATLFFQTGQFDEAVAALKAIVDAQPSAATPRLLLGDVYAAMNRPSDAEAQYDHALRIDPNGGSGPSLVRLGNMYVALGKFKDALGAFLLAAKAWPCGLTWLGAGIAYYRMDDLVRAEQALNESNILNNLNARTWGYLSLVCLRQRREEEGDQAFNQAIKQGLDDPHLTAEIGVEQFRLGRYKIAEACFRRSLALLDDCNTRMHLGRTLAAMKRLPEARDEFAYVARMTANEAQRARAEEQVAQLPAE